MSVMISAFMRLPVRYVLLVTLALISACQTVPPKPATNTLSDIDVNKGESPKESVFIKPKSQEEIREAYDEYLNNAQVDEKTRLDALTRLAELEYKDSGQLLQEKPGDQADDTLSSEQKLYYERLQRTIALLSTSIKDYPNAKGNDTVLYQLAKAQAQNDQYDDSIESLQLLVDKYPQSPYYVEAQFRIAEDAFSVQDFSAAEYAYSEVIASHGNEIFYEKSLFKRGWSRFKQEYYFDSIEDYIEAVVNHEFGVYETLNAADRDQFDEYFRAIALSFTYLNEPDKLAEYFKNRPDFQNTYHVYQMVGDLYLQQERFSDAVETHRHFIKHFPNSDNIPYSYLKIIEIWKDSGFNRQIYQSIEDYYLAFNPASKYWLNQNENSKVNRVTRRSLREYIVLMTSYFHNRYQSNQKSTDYQQADKWYQRYLQYYEAYAQQDNIFFLYGELLAQKNNNQQALKYYELAAFDNEQILHKESAYAAIVQSNSLFEKTGDQTYLNKYIAYSKRFVQQFSQDKRTLQTSLHASEQAYLNKQYTDAIELADLALLNNKQASSFQSTQIKASAYFYLNEFEEAESLYRQIFTLKNPGEKQRGEFETNLALSIYRQAEAASKKDDIGGAIYHYARISTLVPKTEVASTGLYDAIALNVKHKQWNDAITLIERFKQLYPQHKFTNDISKKALVAYLGSNQNIKAAREFEKIARSDSDIAVKGAAQWRAAEIYEEKGQIKQAIRAYRAYSESFKKPYSQLLEAMDKVASLYSKDKSFESSRRWYQDIIALDEKALNNVRTDISRQITSKALLALARFEKNRFDSLKLSLPLKNSLLRKKAAMQQSVKLYGQASINKVYDITTEATFSIAKIYQDFSHALLKSDRPRNLNEEELDQYEILLEDQAFPFEDKSIEFFEINLSRVRDGLYNDWIEKSLEKLKVLFPVRYGREPKKDDYVAGMR